MYLPRADVTAHGSFNSMHVHAGSGISREVSDPCMHADKAEFDASRFRDVYDQSDLLGRLSVEYEKLWG